MSGLFGKKELNNKIDPGQNLDDGDAEKLTVNGVEVHLKTSDEREAELEARKEELNRQLAEKEIDVTEYNKRLMDLYRPVVYVPKPSRWKRILQLMIVVLIILIASIPGAFYIWWRFYFQNTLTASKITKGDMEASQPNEYSPIQIEASGSEEGEYKGRKIKIDYKYYYEMDGTVSSVHDYWGFDDYATLVPRDVCMVWGSLADAYKSGEVEFRQSGRYCNGRIPGDSVDYSERFTYKTPFGQTRTGLSSMSNNHLIPSTTEIRDQIFGLRAGDNVKIVGYLVDVHYGSIILQSSTKRADSGNGACEVIYVTDIKKKDAN